MPAIVLLIIGMLGCIVSLLFFAITSENRGYIRWYDFGGFYLVFGTLILWFTLFAATETKYDVKTYKTLSQDNTDYFYDQYRGYHNANSLFGRRLEEGTEVTSSREIPRFGLVWNAQTTFQVKE